MSYIAPNSDIWFYSDIPFDTGYRNQTIFANRNAQNTYFHDKIKYHLTEQSYFRETQGVLKVNLTVAQLLECNYLSFKNRSFANKDFYAFITNVEYVSNEVTRVTYQIDLIQSYQFDFTIKQCFVEREHVTDDSIGANTLNESLPIGDLICNNEREFKTNGTAWGTADVLYILETVVDPSKASQDISQSGVSGGIYNGVPSGGKFYQYNNIFDLKQDLDAIIKSGKAEAIISVFSVPALASTNVEKPVLGSLAPTWNESGINKLSAVNTYTPKNKKLLTYPYYQLHVANNNNSVKVFRPERFSNPVAMGFTMYAIMSKGTSCTLVPQGYNGLTYDYNNTISLAPFPTGSWFSSPYQEWYNQHGDTQILSYLTGIMKGTMTGFATGSVIPGLGSTTGAIVGGLTSAVTGIMDYMTNDNELDKLPSQTGGNTTSSVITGLNKNCFVFRNMTITQERARSFDDYFEKVGYKVNRLKVPNINTRPYWNFVKTNGATVESSLPYDVEDAICKILDNGITFWKNPNNVGNYSLNNH